MTRNLLLSGGPTHDFDATSAAVAALLAGDQVDADTAGSLVDTTIVTEPAEFFTQLRLATDGRAEPWDLLTVNALRWRMDADRYAPLRDDFAYHLDPADAALIAGHVHNGGGLLALHTAVICFDADPAWSDLTGASWNWDASSHPPLGVVDVDVTEAGRRHPITMGLESFHVVDEVYGFLDEVDGIEPLLTGNHGGRTHPLLWARPVGDGRVVTDLLGHGLESAAHPVHRTILRRAAAWAVGDRGRRREGSLRGSPD